VAALDDFIRIVHNTHMIPQPFLADPRLAHEIAQGVEHPDIVAARYNLTIPEWERLKADPAFQMQVENRKAELKREGHSFRAKCALAAEDLIGDVYVLAKAKDTGLTTKLDAAKWFAKMGNLEPKEEKSSALLGAGFSITIDMGDGKSVTLSSNGQGEGAIPERVIDGEATEIPGHILSMPFAPGELAMQAAA